MRSTLRTLALLSFVLPASADTAAESPIEIRGPIERAGEQELALRPLAVAALLAHQSVELAGFPLSDGTRVDLQLERLDLQQLELGIHVDGAPAPGLLEGLDLSVWQGHVAGRRDSQASLSFSQAGAEGWVLIDGALHHLMSRGAEEVWMLSESRILELGGSRGAACASDALPANQLQARAATGVRIVPGTSPGVTSVPGTTPPTSGGTTGAGRSGSPTLYKCPIAIETDWQLNQVFGGNLQAEITYVVSLLTWVSYRYEEQIGTVLTYPYVQFYTTPNDPWHTPDVGGYLSCIDLLYELQTAWLGNIPAGANLAHFLSGANLGCGAAFLGGLCDPARNFGVTGNIDGNNQFPIQVGPSNFNFYGVTHELGHNFNAIHTHDYCPPLDECPPAAYFGPCQTQRVCTTQGTLMSYCHGCPGGFSNITTYFHARSVADMRGWVEATCLSPYGPDPQPYCVAKLNSAGCLPIIGWEGHPTLSGLDDFVVTGELLVNNKVGMLLHGTASASAPFGGGTLCVGGSVVRTVPQVSGGTPPPALDCSGTFRYVWSHAQLAALGAGTTRYVQYWYRDPLATGGVGLTDALSINIVD